MKDVAQSGREVAKSDDGKRRVSLSRLLPLVVLAAGFVAFFVLGFDQYFTFEALSKNRDGLTRWVGEYGFLAVFAFIVGYAVVVAFSLPGATLMSIAGGFLFGIAATLYIVVGATTGATILFLAAKTALGGALRARAGGFIEKMAQRFHDNAFSYLLFLRLVPAFPFWLVNLVPAFLGVPLKTFVSATFIGIIPGALVYAGVGRGLGSVFDAGQSPDFDIVFKPEILLPFTGLAILALLPVIYTRFSKKGSS